MMKSQNQVALKDYQCPQCYSFSLDCSGGFLAGSSEEQIGNGTNEGFTAQEAVGFEF